MDDFFGKTSRNTAPDRRASTSAARVNSTRGKKQVRFRLPPSPPSPEQPLANGTMPGTRLVRRGGKFTPRVIRVTRSTALKDEPNNSSGSSLSPTNRVKRVRTSTSLKACQPSVPVGALNGGSCSGLTTVIESSQRTWSNSPPGSRTTVEAIDNSCPSAATTLPSPESQVKSCKTRLPPNLSWPIYAKYIPGSSAMAVQSFGSQVDYTVGLLRTRKLSPLIEALDLAAILPSHESPYSLLNVSVLIDALDLSTASTVIRSDGSQVGYTGVGSPPNLSQPIDVEDIPSSSAGILSSSRSQVGNTRASSPSKLSPQIEALNLSCPKEVINDASISTVTSPPSSHPTDHHNLIGNTAGSGNDATISTATLPQSNHPIEDPILPDYNANPRHLLTADMLSQSLLTFINSSNRAIISTATLPPSSHPTEGHILVGNTEGSGNGAPISTATSPPSSLSTDDHNLVGNTEGSGNGTPISTATSPQSSHPTNDHNLIGNTAGSGNGALISTATSPPSSHPTDDHILPDYYAIPSHLLPADMRSQSLCTITLIPVANSVNQFGVRIIHP